MKTSFTVSLLLILAIILLPAKLSADSLQIGNKGNITNKTLFKTENVSVVDGTNKNTLKKYSVVVGKFGALEEANSIKNKFAEVNENALIVKAAGQELYYVVIKGCDFPDIASLRLKEVLDNTSNLTKSQQVSKYGIALDDLWILISK